ncbi:hypothetical protein [Actinomadura formosensis]
MIRTAEVLAVLAAALGCLTVLATPHVHRPADASPTIPAVSFPAGRPA